MTKPKDSGREPDVGLGLSRHRCRRTFCTPILCSANWRLGQDLAPYWYPPTTLQTGGDYVVEPVGEMPGQHRGPGLAPCSNGPSRERADAFGVGPSETQ